MSADASVLYERDGELAVLHQTLVDARRRQGAIVLVTGEAGIGKSALVRAWLGAPDLDARVLLGWCDDFLTSRTFGPLHDVGRAAHGELAEALEAGDLGRVLEAVLGELGNPLQPTVLVLEDVHWADEATLDVVRFVGRRIPGLPAVLVLTYREGDVGPDHPLRSVLGALPFTVVNRIVPRPLSRSAVAALTAGTGLDPDEVARVTGGNPFFVTELAQGSATVPASVADAVLARVRKLSPRARQGVEALAVVPGAVASDLVTALVPDLADLADAERAGVLHVEGDRVGFRHELARQAVLGSLPKSEQARHHAIVLEHLLAVAADPARILHHAVGAGATDVVVSHGPLAATQAHHAGAAREAIAHHDRVLRHRTLLAPESVAAVLEEHAWSLYSVLRFADALNAAEEAADLRGRLADTRAHVRALVTLARMRYMGNRPDRAVEALDQAATLLEAADDERLRAEMRAEQLALLCLTDRHEEALALGPEVIERARALDRVDLEIYGLVYLGESMVLGGDPDGFALVEAAADLGRRRGQLEPRARSHGNLIELLVTARRWDDALAFMEEASRFYDDHDFGAGRYHTAAHQARIFTLRGQWAEAKELLGRIAEDEASAGILEGFALGTATLLAVRSGADDARARLERAWTAALQSRSAAYIVPVACAALELAWVSGRPGDAEPYLEPAFHAAGATVWLGHLRWRLPLVGAAPDAAGVVTEPERTSLVGDWRNAADGWADLGMPFEQALELLRSGEEAATLQALRLLEELGAQPAAGLARQQLRELGVRHVPRGPLRQTRQNPAGLTERQLEVVVLLAEGLSNQEIAERLFLSHRTVEHHVAAILTKLGVTNRAAASEAARALGIGAGR